MFFMIAILRGPRFSISPNKNAPVGIQLSIRSREGGEELYRKLVEKVFRDRLDEYSDEDEDYYDAKQDLYAFQDGRLDLMEEDPEIDSAKYRMVSNSWRRALSPYLRIADLIDVNLQDYHVAIKTTSGEEVGHVKFVIFDLANAEFHQFWSAFEYQHSTVRKR